MSSLKRRRPDPQLWKLIATAVACLNLPDWADGVLSLLSTHVVL